MSDLAIRGRFLPATPPAAMERVRALEAKVRELLGIARSSSRCVRTTRPASGSADFVTSGSYAMDAGIARGTIETDELALEVATAAEPEAPIIDGIRWQLDTEGHWKTLQFDVISCD